VAVPKARTGPYFLFKIENTITVIISIFYLDPELRI
jgi:hypothetical protein